MSTVISDCGEGLPQEWCREVREYLVRGLQAKNAEGMFERTGDGADARILVDQRELLVFYKAAGGPAKWLQRKCQTVGKRAGEIFWVWVGTEMSRADGCLTSKDGALLHPVLRGSGWVRTLVDRVGWNLHLHATHRHIFRGLCRTVVEWLRERCSIVCGVPYCEHEMLVQCGANLHSTFNPLGGRFVYWTCVMFVAFKGEIVGDIRRYALTSEKDEREWIAEGVLQLCQFDVISKPDADMLRGEGKYAPRTPPLPGKTQEYVMDLCCGYMSLYFDCLQNSEIGYVCADYRPRLWSGKLHGWLRPHVVVDFLAVRDPVEFVLDRTSLKLEKCLLLHSSPPCTSHSTASSIQGEKGYGMYGAAGEECGTYRHDTAVAEVVVGSQLRAHQINGVMVSIENPAYGTFRDLACVQVPELTRYTVSYCSWGFRYQKPSSIYVTSQAWDPEGNGTNGACVHRRHPEAKAGREGRVAVPGLTEKAVICRIPGGLIQELVELSLNEQQQLVRVGEKRKRLITHGVMEI
jgi:hypothetical protein